MHFLVIAPLVKQVPPIGYGGAERVVAWQVRALRQLGHNVTLVAVQGSTEPADTAVLIEPSEHRAVATVLHLIRRGNYDFGIDHTQRHYFSKSLKDDIRWITYTHGIGEPGPNAIACSRDQSIKWNMRFRVPVVYHGVDVAEYGLCEEKQDYCLFVGKLNEIKGALEFVDFCGRMKMHGLLVGNKHDTKGTGYADRVLKQVKDSKFVRYLGEKGGQEKTDLLKKAKFLVFPTKIREACPIVVLEAFACGTPVVSWDIGPVRELVTADTGVLGKGIDVDFLCEALASGLPSPKVVFSAFMHQYTHLESARGLLDVVDELLYGCKGF